MKKIVILISFLLALNVSKGQSIDSIIVSNIYKNALESYESYNNLKGLIDTSFGRMIGNEASLKAVNYLENILQNMDVDTVYLQEFTSSAWICNSTSVSIVFNGTKTELAANALGPSVATIGGGIDAEVVEVKSFEDLQKLGKEKIEGKVVFFNNEIKQGYYNTFQGYGDAILPRILGAVFTSSYGGVGTIIRSLSISNDDFPHTGVTRYRDTVEKVPTIAISTNSADLLSENLKKNPHLKINLKVDAKDIEEVVSYNIIAEIKGYENPEKIIVVGGHTDTWYNSPGAHDDGAGCMHSIEILRIFKDLGIKNRNTIRLVLFMDEETNQSGGKFYAESIKDNFKNHIFALESDAGGLTPYGFSLKADEAIVDKINEYCKLMRPYNIWSITQGHAGVDIGPMAKYKIPLSAMKMDSQRYFDYHHSANDTFDKINRRELQLGSATMAALIYMVDKYGLE